MKNLRPWIPYLALVAVVLGIIAYERFYGSNVPGSAGFVGPVQNLRNNN